ncbi:hypothetical protein DFH28DRAFT_526680 [Melampsora americana]|nr:hypothetical protein DFH28DRAFT_526680 [Melampsora americana]
MYFLFFLLVVQSSFILVISVRPPEEAILDGNLGQGFYQERCLKNSLKPGDYQNEKNQIIDTEFHSQHEGYLNSVQAHLIDETDFLEVYGANHLPGVQSDICLQEVGTSHHEGTHYSPGSLREEILNLLDDEHHPSTSSAYVSKISTNGKENHITDPYPTHNTWNGKPTENNRDLGIESLLDLPGKGTHYSQGSLREEILHLLDDEHHPSTSSAYVSRISTKENGITDPYPTLHTWNGEPTENNSNLGIESLLELPEKGTHYSQGSLREEILHLLDDEHYPSTSIADFSSISTNGKENYIENPHPTLHPWNGKPTENNSNFGIESLLELPGNRCYAYDTTLASSSQPTSAPVHEPTLVKDSSSMKMISSQRNENQNGPGSFNEDYLQYSLQGGQFEHASISQFQQDPVALDHLIIPGIPFQQLQEEGRLVVQNTFHLYSKIYTAFEVYQENIPIIFQNDPTVTHNQIQSMIQHFETGIIFPFLGAIHAIFKGKPNTPQMEVLLIDGWEFLNGDLSIELSNHFDALLKLDHASYKKELESHWPSQGRLLGHLLKLRSNSTTSVKMVQALLIRWSENTIYTPDQYGINIKNIMFSKQYENGGKEKREIQQDMKIPDNLSVQEKINFLSKDPERMQPTFKISPSIYVFLKTIGTNLFQLEVSFLMEVEQFFKDLHSSISSDLCSKLSSDPNFQSKNVELLLENSISMSVKTITPIFMAILWIMHEQKTFNQTWEEICDSGWNFLKHHFLLWKDIFKDEEELNNFLTQYKSNQQDFPDTQYTLLTFAINSEKRRLSMKPAWDLVDMWYKSFTGEPFSPFSFNQYMPTNLNMIEQLHQNQMIEFERHISRRSSQTYNKNEMKRKGCPSLGFIEEQSNIFLSTLDNSAGSTSGHKKLKPSTENSTRLPRFLVSFGRGEIGNQKDFSQETQKYFKLLETKMLQSLSSAKATYLKDSVSGPSIPFIQDRTVSKALNIFRVQVMPAFMATLILTHQDPVSPDSARTLLWSGWNYLKNLFTQWETLFLDCPSEIFLSIQKKFRDSTDWNKPEDMFKFMTTHKQKDDVPMYLVLNLTDQWYISLTNNNVNSSGSVRFKMPDLKELRKIHKSFQGKKKTEESK